MIATTLMSLEPGAPRNGRLVRWRLTGSLRSVAGDVVRP